MRRMWVPKWLTYYCTRFSRDETTESPFASLDDSRCQPSRDVRATMFLTMAAKAKALMEHRYHVTYEDLQALALPIMRHRVLVNFHAESDRVTVDDVLKQAIQALPVPTGE
jgi:MoxR-like ATPase